jgi:hypothetical protein
VGDIELLEKLVLVYVKFLGGGHGCGEESGLCCALLRSRVVADREKDFDFEVKLVESSPSGRR